jgi:hypothetical protein
MRRSNALFLETKLRMAWIGFSVTESKLKDESLTVYVKAEGAQRDSKGIDAFLDGLEDIGGREVGGEIRVLWERVIGQDG